LIFELTRWGAVYHIVRNKACKSGKLHCAELFGHPPSLHAGFAGAPLGHQRLSSQWLFLIMRPKKSTHPMPARKPGKMR
jgi:hypothetical protein